MAGYLYISPWFVGLLVFTAGPVVASFVLSLTSYDVLNPTTFVGLENYRVAFTEDPLFWSSLRRTLVYALANIPLSLAGSLLLALLLNQAVRGTNVFRTFFFMPHLVPVVAATLLWKWLLEPNFGLINTLLWQVGIEGPPWLSSSTWALPSMVLISLWGSVGGNRMLIFLAGLQNIPEPLYEAAEIDGAGAWARFWNVTVPMLTPTVFFNLVLGVIGALKVFTAAYVATEGGPAYATWFYALHIYAQGFKYFQMGYASALSWIFLSILMIFTWVQVKSSQRWVYYEGAS